MILDRQGVPLSRGTGGDRPLRRGCRRLAAVPARGRKRDGDSSRARTGPAHGPRLNGYLGVLGTEPDDASATRESLDSWLGGLDRGRLHERERARLEAATAWLHGDMLGCGELLQQISDRYPRRPGARCRPSSRLLHRQRDEPARPNRRCADGLERGGRGLLARARDVRVRARRGRPL